MIFKNREEAGSKLAVLLEKYRGQDAVLYALPRGGVVLGGEIAGALKIPLRLVVTRKIGHQYDPEYAMCAVAEDGDMICDEGERSGVDADWFKEEIAKEIKEAKRRREVYSAGKAPISAKGKIAIIVDDGIATGMTMRLAVMEILHDKPAKIIVAAPFVLGEAFSNEEKGVDELVVIESPKKHQYAFSIGELYDEFAQVEDDEVVKIMKSTS